MAGAIVFERTGGPEVLEWTDVHVGEPEPGMVRVRHDAVGLNFADTYFRTGLYPAPLPSGMGVEAAGVVEEVGPGVTGFAPGVRVTYTGSPLGAYSTERVMPVDSLIHLPDAIPGETAAAMTMRGLTSAYLLRRIAPDLTAGDTVLLQAAAGGVGLIVCQWARLLGIRVIGVVSTQEKAEVARAHGAAEVIVGRDDTARRVRDLTDGNGAKVVYDSVGAATYAASLDSVAPRGLLVCFGTASGPIPPIDAVQLAMKGSIKVTRPALADYIRDPAERAELAGELFGHVAAGDIRIEINQRYPLREAARAHVALESGASVGSSVLTL
ncbi:MAG TPA: quinone oxidoreductase [Intrasporangium sp.]|uniref:quinone oxidoreductase family protein n=1 Tax=Intrasporangium sp. TaxID=1925024 RepID=UPI002D789400|nr:quinone oxidoreductase [Intrasporangium sp.]HET7397048.1 quinone oxidoreductase [Intrasporangium sp.]